MAGHKFIPKMDLRERRSFTAEELLNYLSYDDEKGHFYWKVRVHCHGGGRNPGDLAGTSKDGYCQIKVFGRHYRSHHLVWLIKTGAWPPVGLDIDHRNGNKSDNRWLNLRLATRTQNNANTPVRETNSTGFTGVYRQTDGKGKFFARITLNKRSIHLGTFDSIDDAVHARKKAEIDMFGEFSTNSR